MNTTDKYIYLKDVNDFAKYIDQKCEFSDNDVFETPLAGDIIAYNSSDECRWGTRLGWYNYCRIKNPDYKPEPKKRRITIKEMFDAGVMGGGVENDAGCVMQIDIKLSADSIGLIQDARLSDILTFIKNHKLVAWYDREGNRRDFWMDED